MTRRLSAAQVAGLALVVILAIYGVAAFVKYVTDDIFDGIFDAPVRFTGPIFATMAVMLLMVIAAVTATIALAARKGGLAKLTGALALLALLVGFVGQIWLISTL
ncbi:MAG: hypothetical protein JWP31_2015, partial [Aeromicrobium sp.]|nr:hypothetical protein [Aeromicrobium sp.]